MTRSSGKFGLAGREENGNDSGAVRAVGVKSLSAYTAKGLFLAERFEVDQLHLSPL